MAKAKDPPGIPPGKTYDGLSYLACDTIGDLDHGLARHPGGTCRPDRRRPPAFTPGE